MYVCMYAGDVFRKIFQYDFVWKTYPYHARATAVGVFSLSFCKTQRKFKCLSKHRVCMHVCMYVFMYVQYVWLQRTLRSSSPHSDHVGTSGVIPNQSIIECMFLCMYVCKLTSCPQVGKFWCVERSLMLSYYHYTSHSPHYCTPPGIHIHTYIHT